MRITEPLREEHRDLLPHIEELRSIADSVGGVPADTLREEVETAYTFLIEHLIPHATAEDRVLYPVVARVMGAPEATATMSRDHVAVGSLTSELGNLRLQLSADASPELLKGLRRVLYGLYALVSTHFAKEEEIYLPLLDARMTAEEARDVFERMENSAVTARGAAVSV